jgi:hypothetical protein
MTKVRPASAGAGVGRQADGRFGEGSFRRCFALPEGIVVQESGGAEGLEKMLLDLADGEIAGGADQIFAEVEAAVLAIEKLQTGDETGRNDEGRVRVLKRVANDESGFVGNRRRKEIEMSAEAWKHDFASLAV